MVSAMRGLLALAGSLVGPVMLLAATVASGEDSPPAAPPVQTPSAAPAPPSGLDVTLSQSAPGRRIPWDQLDGADYLLVRDVVKDAVVAQEVRDIAFRSRKPVFEFLLAHPDFAADIARLLKEGKYRLRRVGEVYEADDGHGVHGVMRPMIGSGARRLFYLEGSYDTTLLPTLTGRAVLVLDAEHVEGPDGVTYCDMRIAGYLKLDQTLPAAMIRVAKGFSETQVDRRVRRFFRHVAAVSRRAYDDPEGLAEDVARQPGLAREMVDGFRAVLLAHRPPPWAESQGYRLLDEAETELSL